MTSLEKKKSPFVLKRRKKCPHRTILPLPSPFSCPHAVLIGAAPQLQTSLPRSNVSSARSGCAAHTSCWMCLSFPPSAGVMPLLVSPPDLFLKQHSPSYISFGSQKGSQRDLCHNCVNLSIPELFSKSRLVERKFRIRRTTWKSHKGPNFCFKGNGD